MVLKRRSANFQNTSNPKLLQRCDRDLGKNMSLNQTNLKALLFQCTENPISLFKLVLKS